MADKEDCIHTTNLPAKDFSVKNPKLHRLYVIYAQEDLQIIEEFLERLSEVSRVNMSILAGMVAQERSRLLRSDAAYREALWRITANDLLKEEPQPFEVVGVE